VCVCVCVCVSVRSLNVLRIVALICQQTDSDLLFSHYLTHPNFLQVSMMWECSLCSMWYLSICWYLRDNQWLTWAFHSTSQTLQVHDAQIHKFNKLFNNSTNSNTNI